ncbi:hypothetical protein J6590_052369 [Homalodisca vitripennis]|nr:hypothetical protein J6590_052369 [Homalodisca vitripennis]
MSSVRDVRFNSSAGKQTLRSRQRTGREVKFSTAITSFTLEINFKTRDKNGPADSHRPYMVRMLAHLASGGTFGSPARRDKCLSQCHQTWKNTSCNL